MRRTGRGWALLSAALIAMPLAGCTGIPYPAATPPPAQPADSAASSPAPAGESTLACGDSIDEDAQVGPLRVVLGVVALPVSPGYQALETSPTGAGNGALRLFAKTGLLVKPGTAFELIVPGQFAGHLSIGWGSPGTPSQRVVVSDCANPGGGWLAYAGGYWIDHPACVAIVVRAGGQRQQVRIGLGTPCPGQQAPPGSGRQGPGQG